MRAKLKLLCQDMGRAMQWNTELAKDWIAHLDSSEQYFYCDGHVRVYHGDQTKLPRHHVAREKLCSAALSRNDPGMLSRNDPPTRLGRR